MSTKQQREAEARDAHRTKMQADKARRQQAPTLRRAAPVREENPVLLILCQGEVTEVEYFRHFELATATIEAVGKAFDPEKLVEHALELREQAKRRKEPYDQVWCVFDKDDTRPGNFNAAIQRAQGNGLEVAFSNQAFEFWLLLHFDDHQGGGMRREACGERVSELIAAINPRVSYNSKKGKHVSRDLFDVLEADDPSAQPGRLPRRKVAIGRARAIAARWDAEGTEWAQQESVTWVYKLVMVLQRHLPA